MGIKFNPLTGQFDLTGSSGEGGIVIGDPITGANPNAVLVTDATGALDDSGTLTNGQIVIGSTGNPPVAGSLTGTAGEIIITPGPGTLNVGLDPDIQDQIDDKANISLNNLAATSVNVDILPISGNTIDLGSVALPWNDIYTSNTRTNSISTISGSGSVAFLNSINMNGNEISMSAANIVQVADPLNPQDATTKNYVDTRDALYIPLTQKAANNGVATLDAGGKIPAAQLPNTVMEYQGNWDASTNTPTLADGVGNTGDVYRVNVAGTQDLGSGSQTFAVGDFVIYNGTIWEKSVNSNNVVSVNGQQGVVVLDTDDITEATNLYYTDERAQDSVGTILTDSSTIDFTYDDATPSITAIVVDGSITNAKVASGIDSVKIGSGLVSNVEFDYLDGATSNIQDQIDSIVLGSSVWQKFTVSHTLLQTASTTNSITLATTTDRIIEGIVIAHSVAASGGTISAYDLTVGIIGEEDRFATAYDAFISPTSTNHNIYHILDIPERGTAVNVLLTATSTGDNLDQSVAGTFIIYVKTSSIE